MKSQLHDFVVLEKILQNEYVLAIISIDTAENGPKFENKSTILRNFAKILAKFAGQRNSCVHVGLVGDEEVQHLVDPRVVPGSARKKSRLAFPRPFKKDLEKIKIYHDISMQDNVIF